MKPAASPKLAPFLQGVRIGNALRHKQLALLPLAGGAPSPLDYILAADAIATGLLTITEVSEGGSVPELLVSSSADKLTLLIDGEELVGAKQNRILNTSVLLPAGVKTCIPVSCVEQGRWRFAARHFQAGGYAPSRLRAIKNRSVGRSLREQGRPTSDQGAVWNEIACQMADLKACSPTGAMHAAFEQHRDSIEEYTNALPCPADARGVLVAVGGRFVALDLFDRPATLGRIWPRLVTGYALDALAETEPASEEYSADSGRVLLEQITSAACTVCPTVGLGEDWRFEAETTFGQALIVEGVCVHLSAFPGAAEGRGARTEGRILPPSARRRRTRRPEEGEE